LQGREGEERGMREERMEKKRMGEERWKKEISEKKMFLRFFCLIPLLHLKKKVLLLYFLNFWMMFEE